MQTNPHLHTNVEGKADCCVFTVAREALANHQNLFAKLLSNHLQIHFKTVRFCSRRLRSNHLQTTKPPASRMVDRVCRSCFDLRRCARANVREGARAKSEGAEMLRTPAVDEKKTRQNVRHPTDSRIGMRNSLRTPTLPENECRAYQHFQERTAPKCCAHRHCPPSPNMSALVCRWGMSALDQDCLH